MSYNTVIQQGRFTSTGAAQTIAIRSDVDWMWVYNETILNDAALAADAGAQFYWQRGMTNGRGLEYRKLGTVANDPLTTVQIAANAGFFLLDTSGNPVGAAIAATGINNAATFTVTTGNTGSLTTGSIVRLSGDTNLPNLMGFDFEVDTVVANTSFDIRWALANIPGAVGAGDGFYRHIAFDTMFYPRNRFIIDATNANPMVITMSVTHAFTVGQEVRIIMPEAFDMVEADGLQATIVAVNAAANTISVDIDSSAFTAFVFPAVADYPFNWAQVVPVGEDTGQALISGADILADATRNTAIIGMRLEAGVNSPAGALNDVIYWVAGKSFSVNNL